MDRITRIISSLHVAKFLENIEFGFQVSMCLLPPVLEPIPGSGGPGFDNCDRFFRGHLSSVSRICVPPSLFLLQKFGNFQNSRWVGLCEVCYPDQKLQELHESHLIEALSGTLVHDSGLEAEKVHDRGLLPIHIDFGIRQELHTFSMGHKVLQFVCVMLVELLDFSDVEPQAVIHTQMPDPDLAVILKKFRFVPLSAFENQGHELLKMLDPGMGLEFPLGFGVDVAEVYDHPQDFIPMKIFAFFPLLKFLALGLSSGHGHLDFPGC